MLDSPLFTLRPQPSDVQHPHAVWVFRHQLTPLTHPGVSVSKAYPPEAAEYTASRWLSVH